MEKKQIRVMLWCTPRSVSTAFVRAMENIPDIELFIEPFLVAHHFGPERRMVGLDAGQPIEEEFTYASVRNMLEGKFSDKKVIFVKDMGYAIDGKYEYLPSGYQHFILIRNPLKSYLSYFKQISKQRPGFDLAPFFKFALPSGLWYQELLILTEYLEKHQGVAPTIMDADDLVRYPEQMLRKFCEKSGVPYSNSLLSWNGESQAGWNMAKTLWDLKANFDWHRNSFNSTGFDSSIGHLENNSDAIPSSVRDCAKQSQPLYKKLFEKRLQPF